jgi:hypothetical protein
VLRRGSIEADAQIGNVLASRYEWISLIDEQELDLIIAPLLAKEGSGAATAQNVIEPAIWSVYPWNVDLHSNSRKYFIPMLAFRSGNIALAAKPRAFTL